MLHLFEAFGIELEYMIVNSDNLGVLPVTDEVLRSVAGKYVSEVGMGKIDWSNELTLHVIELKTAKPIEVLEGLDLEFQNHIRQINEILEGMGGRLMPTSMHPWMDPLKEMQLWPHENSPIYDAYNRIFDCRGHGWANLQSMHINLPFGSDDEFGRLHAAIRLVLPLLPAIAASSPIAEGKIQNEADYRLEVYRHNQTRVPSIAGKIIPEPVYSAIDYQDHIFLPIFKDIAPFDPEGILQYEWLNSRGAIARFERNAIEIRLLDIQECPTADIAIAGFVIDLIKAHVSEKWISFDEQKKFTEDDLSYVLLDAIREGEKLIIKNDEYLSAFGATSNCLNGTEFLRHLWNNLQDEEIKYWREPINHILQAGTLSTRIKNRLGFNFSNDQLGKIYLDLCDCLRDNKMFL